MKVEKIRLDPLGPHELLAKPGIAARLLSTSLPALQVGQEVTAEVVEQLPTGRLLINLQGTLLEADAPEGLQAGTELFARVEQLQPHIVLRLLDAGQEVDVETTRLLRAYLPHHTTVGDSLLTLQRELGKLLQFVRLNDALAEKSLPYSATKLHTVLTELLPPDTPPDAEHLAAFVRDGGLLYETKLGRHAEDPSLTLSTVAEKDLKGILLQTLKEAVITPMPAEFQEAVRGHLEHIESQQAVNLLAQTHGEPCQLQIPFFTGQGLSTAFLSIESDGGRQEKTGKRGNGETGKGYSVLFLLDLEGFGPIRIDAHLTTKTLRVIFYAEQKSAVSLIQSELRALQETLQSLGYTEVLLAAKPLGQLSPEKRRKFEALAVGAPQTVNLLDVRA